MESYFRTDSNAGHFAHSWQSMVLNNFCLWPKHHSNKTTSLSCSDQMRKTDSNDHWNNADQHAITATYDTDLWSRNLTFYTENLCQREKEEERALLSSMGLCNLFQHTALFNHVTPCNCLASCYVRYACEAQPALKARATLRNSLVGN